MHCEGYNSDHTPVSPAVNTRTEFEEWNVKVSDYLKKELGYSYHQRKEAAGGIVVFPPPGMSEANTQTWGFVKVRMMKLEEFIKELK